MNKMALYNALSLTGFYVIAFFISLQIAPVLNSKFLFLGLFASWLILMVGIQIVHFKFKTGQFVNRFLMTTTFQLMAFLALAIFLIFGKIQGTTNLLLAVVFTHMAGLFIQSMFFLKHGNKVS